MWTPSNVEMRVFGSITSPWTISTCEYHLRFLSRSGWRAIARGASAELVARGAYAGEQLLGAGPEQDARRRARAAAARAWWLPPGQPHPVYGDEDPLSEDPLKALPLDVNLQVLRGLAPKLEFGGWV